MSDRGKGKEAVHQFDEQARDELSSSKNVIVISSSSDEDENPSLRIEEQARYGPAFIDLSPSSTPEPGSILDGFGAGGEVAIGAKSKRKVSKVNARTNKKKIKKSTESKEASEAGLADENKAGEVTAGGLNRMEELDAAQTTGDTILRKLLRGPRYFDPLNSEWLSCYNCGKEGHMAVNCTSVKRKKPCFICGSMEHNSRACTEGQDCFVCKKGGHRAKDCPDKYKSATRSLKMCLKCGNSGHDMFTCNNDYSLNDLKEIQCYVCKSFGHLCCGKFEDGNLGEVSCYQCGRLGHSGLACLGGESPGAGSLSSCYKCGEEGHFARECIKACTRSGRDTPVVGSLTSCYKCGEEGHFARECVKAGKRSGRKAIVAESVKSCYKCGEEGHFARGCKKVGKRNLQLSTPTKKSPKKAKGYIGFRSVPPDIGKSAKKRKTQCNENGITASHKSKHRGGWTTEHVGEVPYWKAKGGKGWNSPATPSKRSFNIGWNSPATPNRSINISAISGRECTLSSQKMAWQNFGTQLPQGLNTQHKFSAVRFGNFSNPGMRNYGYGWW